MHDHANVLVGVSGGADSLALLYFLNQLKSIYNLQLTAMSVDHMLRGEESKEDVDHVLELCEEWEIPFISQSVDVKKAKQSNHEGTQINARKLRYEAFEQVMLERSIDYLALGHHGDDQIETFLMRAVQHTNPSLLTAIPVKRPFSVGQIIRPFLITTKKEIYQYCQTNQIRYREDPSNQSDTYTRNYYRIHVTPMLKQKNPTVHRTIQHLTERLTEDEAYLMEEANKMFQKVVTKETDKKILKFNIPSFITYPIALQRRVLHLILNYLYQEVPEGVSFQHEEDFLQLIKQKKANVTIDFPQALQITRSYEEITFHFKEDKANELREKVLDIHIPGETLLHNGASIRASYSIGSLQEGKNNIILPLDPTLFPLRVRTRQDGDRMRVRGLGGTKKIKDIFIDEKIPLPMRNIWPLVVTNDDTILWIVGLKKAAIDLNKSAMNCLLLEYMETK